MNKSAPDTLVDVAARDVQELDLRQVKRHPAHEGALDDNGLLIVHPHSFWQQFSQLEISVFCAQYAVYCVPTLELVDWLRERIAGRKAIEIGAGNGALAAKLGIIATDSKMQEREDVKRAFDSFQTVTVTYGPNVEPLDAQAAQIVHRPEVIIGCYVTFKYFKRDHWRGGSMFGVREEKLLGSSEYIFVGNRYVHRNKPLLAYEHDAFEFPWLVSRSMQAEPNYIGVWKRKAPLNK